MTRINHELDPVFNKDSKILILGSLPSIASRKIGFYYAHPKNRFWKILENIFQEEIKDKKEFCLKHHIALWDTIASCEISSSKDSSIKNVIPNDLNFILKHANIKQIFTTGKKAHEIYQKYLYRIYQKEDICLSSTSPANAVKSLEDLVNEYTIILDFLDDAKKS